MTGETGFAEERPGGGAVRYAEGGRELERIATEGDDTVIAVALGGDERRDLYMIVGLTGARIPEIIQGTERPYVISKIRVAIPGAGTP